MTMSDKPSRLEMFGDIVDQLVSEVHDQLEDLEHKRRVAQITLVLYQEEQLDRREMAAIAAVAIDKLARKTVPTQKDTR